MARSPESVAARVRAALAYANIKVKDSGKRVGISAATMARIVSPTDPRGADGDQLDLIADACGVPRWFLERGFDVKPAGANANGDSEVRELRDAVGGMATDILRLQRELQVIRDEGRRRERPGGER